MLGVSPFTEKNCKIFFDFIEKAKETFQSFWLTDENASLGCLIYTDDPEAFSLADSVRYLWRVTDAPASAKIEVIISNHLCLREFVLSMVADIDTCRVSRSQFLLDQEVIVLQKNNVTLFYPLADALHYPILLVIDHVFCVINYSINDRNKRFFWGLYREIFMGYFETKTWVAYHANGILLSNNLGVLIVGATKTGKSILSLGLCTKGGAAYRCDDRIMVKGTDALAVPSCIGISHKTNKTLHIQEFLSSHALFLSNAQGEAPIKLFDKNRTGEDRINLNVMLAPCFNATMGNNYSLCLLPKEKAYCLLMDNCLTSKEIWRDQWVFKRYASQKNLIVYCENQAHTLISNLFCIEIEFGPYINFKSLEREIIAIYRSKPLQN